MDVVLTKYEAQLAAAIQASLDVNQEGLDSLKEQIVTLATSLDTLLNDGLTVAIGCVIPGSKNVKACLDENTVKFNDAIAGLLADALLLLNEALSTVGDILTPVSIYLLYILSQHSARDSGRSIVISSPFFSSSLFK